MSALAAEKLCVFCPSAFSWATLMLMGLRTFPNVYVANDRHGRKVEIPLSTEHMFTTALAVANDTLEKGWTTDLPRPAFEAVTARSAEMSAANQLLTAGLEVSDATLAPLRVLRFTAEQAGAG